MHFKLNLWFSSGSTLAVYDSSSLAGHVSGTTGLWATLTCAVVGLAAETSKVLTNKEVK